MVLLSRRDLSSETENFLTYVFSWTRRWYKSKTVIFMYIQVYVYSCKQLQMKWSLTSHRSDLICFGFLWIELPVISFESGLSVPVCSRSSEAISSNAEGIGGTRLNIVAHKNLLSVLQKVGVESTLVFW